MERYLGIVIEQCLKNRKALKHFDVVAAKAGGWTFLLLSVSQEQFTDLIELLRASIEPSGKWYAHFFRGNELVVVFHDAVFRAATDPTTWGPAVEHGLAAGIPLEQLDFNPHTKAGAEKLFGLSNT